jgi:hypothetical protein
VIGSKSRSELALGLLEAALIAAALLHVALFAIAALTRLTAPFPLEWPEHFSTLHALSMLRGNPIYSAPSMEATSTVYTPGLALLIALGLKLGLPALQIGRVVSLIAISGASLLLFRVVRREGGSRTLGWLAIGTFLAGYLSANRVYDMARVDPSAIALTITGLWLVTRHERLTRLTLLGVGAMVLATFFKQNVGLVCVLCLAGLAWGDRRKGLVALGSYLAGVALVALALDLATGGWFHRWTWTIGSSQPLWPSDPYVDAPQSWGTMLGRIFFHELPAGVPALLLIAALALLVQQVYLRCSRKGTEQIASTTEPSGHAEPSADAPHRISLALVVAPLAALAAALGPRMKMGGGANGWALVFFFGALGAALAIVIAQRLAARIGPRTSQLLYAALLVYATVGLLTRVYDPLAGRPAPRPEHHVAQYAKLLRAVGTPVLAPKVPVITELAGGGPQLMATSLLDLNWSGFGLPPDLARKRDRRHWKAVLLPAGCGPWPPFHGVFDDHYVPVTPIKLPYHQPTGELSHHWLWLPRAAGLQPNIDRNFELQALTPAGLSVRFEGATYHGWTRYGRAFAQPLALSSRLPKQLPVAGYEGRQLLNSFGDSDAATGMLLSRYFVLRGNTIRFRVGGATDPSIAAFELMHEGKVVRQAHGQGSEQLRHMAWDVSPWVGKRVQLRARDSGGGPWGHILVDEVVITREPRRPGERPKAGGYRGWRAEGAAFGDGPARGALPGQLKVRDFRGKRLINSFHGGDSATGSLTSERFVLHGDTISFLVGGSKLHAAFELLVDGKVVLAASGRDSEVLRRVSWDVALWQGRWVQLRAHDWGRGTWGHILVDDITVARRPAGVPHWGDPRVMANSHLCVVYPRIGRGIYPLFY